MQAASILIFSVRIIASRYNKGQRSASAALCWLGYQGGCASRHASLLVLTLAVRGVSEDTPRFEPSRFESSLRDTTKGNALRALPFVGWGTRIRT